MGIDRREFLVAAGAAVATLVVPGCAGADPGQRRPGPVGGGRTAPGRGGICRLTEDNIEGPYYVPGAPFQSELATAQSPGTPLVIRGRVMAADCATPIVGAVLDVWHADHAGHYDNDGSNLVTERSHFRGKLRTDRQGRFELRSILPGRYLNGPTYRPSHVHVKLSARGFAPLTTQLYFEGDPYNERDSFIRRSLVMRLTPAERGGKLATYDFVLARAR